MKTKEVVRLYKEYIANKKTEEATSLIMNFFKELMLSIKEIREKRNVKTNGALLSVFKEVENRWISVANKTGLERKMFREIVGIYSEELKNLWLELESGAINRKIRY